MRKRRRWQDHTLERNKLIYEQFQALKLSLESADKALEALSIVWDTSYEYIREIVYTRTATARKEEVVHAPRVDGDSKVQPTDLSSMQSPD